MTTPVLNKTLWAVNIHGPDDLIPVADYLAALRFANRFNEWWHQQKTVNPLHEYDPRMWAVPVEWPGNAGQHAEWVKNPSPDYAPFLSALSASIPADVAGVVERLIVDGEAKNDYCPWRAKQEAAAKLTSLSAENAAKDARIEDLEAVIKALMESAQYVGTDDDPHWAVPDGEISAARSTLAKESGRG